MYALMYFVMAAISLRPGDGSRYCGVVSVLIFEQCIRFEKLHARK